MKLPNDFLIRMQDQLGGQYAAYLSAMEQPPRRALRVNTLKTDAAGLTRRLSVPLEPVEALPNGFYVPNGFQPARSIAHRAGLFYMQEPSAQLPAAAMPLHAGMAVLDLCAAPGGKTGQIAAALSNTGLIIANEPSPLRARILQGNLERLGVINTAVTCMLPDRLCYLLKGCFDAVLVDAPCSGEAMFRKDEQAVRDWSDAHVRACAVRQKSILEAASAALRPGGTLLYSTCSFSPEENDGQVVEFLGAHPEFSCDFQRHVYPQDGIGEGQYFARLIRSGDAENGMLPIVKGKLAIWEDFCSDFLPGLPPQRAKRLPDGRVFLLPALCTPDYEHLHLLSAGVLAGNIRKDLFFPSHALAMAWPETFRQRVELRGERLRAYLLGEAIPCDAGLSGWCAVSGEGMVVGLGKAVSGILKNHLPKGLRNESKAAH